MILFCIRIRLGEESRVDNEQNRHQGGDVLLFWPDQAQNPKECQTTDKPPHQRIPMPVYITIAQQAIGQGIDNTHKRAVSAE